MTVAQKVDRVIGVEGGYANNPNDRGGPTRWGITEQVARAYGYAGDMRAMPREEAVRIYTEQYWVRPGFAKVDPIYAKVAEELFDTGVNMGPRQAIMFLQRALNALNRQGHDYGDIRLDGDMGPLTVQSLEGYRRVRGIAGEAVLMKALEALQGERYLRISESRPQNETFTYGWLANRVGDLCG